MHGEMQKLFPLFSCFEVNRIFLQAENKTPQLHYKDAKRMCVIGGVMANIKIEQRLVF